MHIGDGTMSDLPDEARTGKPFKYMGGPIRHLVETHGRIKIYFDCCQSAQTLEAYSNRFKCTVFIPLSCKRWSCKFCADRKINHLSRRCETAKPNRLLTLTVDPALWNNPRHGFDGTRRKVPELVRGLRKEWGDVEYMRVTELTHRGWPHYHMLLRSPYIPQPKVKEAWHNLTGATIVDIRKVDNHFQTFHYLVKYLSKMHKLEWTERHVSYSKKFFEKEKELPKNVLELTDTNIRETHPADIFYYQFRKSWVCEIAPRVYTLDPSAQLLAEITAPDLHLSSTQDGSTCQDNPPSSPTSPAVKQTLMEFSTPSTTQENESSDYLTPSGSRRRQRPQKPRS